MALILAPCPDIAVPETLGQYVRSLDDASVQLLDWSDVPQNMYPDRAGAGTATLTATVNNGEVQVAAVRGWAAPVSGHYVGLTAEGLAFDIPVEIIVGGSLLPVDLSFDSYVTDTLAANWSNDAGAPIAGHLMDGSGFVHLQGRVTRSADPNPGPTTILTLPIGLRPRAGTTIRHDCDARDAAGRMALAEVEILDTGVVQWTSGEWRSLSLDDIPPFRAGDNTGTLLAGGVTTRPHQAPRYHTIDVIGGFNARGDGLDPHFRAGDRIAQAVGAAVRPTVQRRQHRWYEPDAWHSLFYNRPVGSAAPDLPQSQDLSVLFLSPYDLDLGAGTGFVGFGLRASIARRSCSRVYEEDHGSFAFSGGTDVNVVVQETATNQRLVTSGYRARKLTANGSTATITTPADFEGGNVVLGCFAKPLEGANATPTVTVDGGASSFVGDIPQGPGVTFKGAAAVMRILNLPAGAHTIVFTFPGIATALYVDWWGVEAPDPPTVAVVSMIRQPSYAMYSSTQTPTDGLLNTYNAALKTVVESFANSMWVDADAIINKQAKYFQAGFGHDNIGGSQWLNEEGHGIVADAVLSKLRDYEPSRKGGRVSRGASADGPDLSFAQLRQFGTSYAADFAFSSQDMRVGAKIAALLGQQEIHHAVSGSRIAAPSEWGKWLQLPQHDHGTIGLPATDDALILADYGTNDTYEVGSNLLWVLRCARTAIAHARASKTFDYNDASVVHTGGVATADITQNYGAGYRLFSQANGDNNKTSTITVPSTFPGGTIGIGIVIPWTTTASANVDVTVDGKAFYTGYDNLQPSVTTAETQHDVIRLKGLTAGSHTIVVTWHFGFVNMQLGFDYWQIESLFPPVVVWGNQSKLNDYTTRNPPNSSDANVDLWNESLVTILNEFDVTVVCPDWDRSTGGGTLKYFGTDATPDVLHPNDEGNARKLGAVLDVIPDKRFLSNQHRGYLGRGRPGRGPMALGAAWTAIGTPRPDVKVQREASGRAFMAGVIRPASGTPSNNVDITSFSSNPFPPLRTWRFPCATFDYTDIDNPSKIGTAIVEVDSSKNVKFKCMTSGSPAMTATTAIDLGACSWPAGPYQ